ncbi:DUF3618 domain-containing protein [Streptomyces sp. NPDC003703]|uniref:DUF3618 domain-containing protein n=1 Tax=Streptomyces sp. NPDC003283 TaxID=3364681 RepID=UPI003692BA15
MTDSRHGTDKAATAPGAKGPDELRAQIERTRTRLGDTVEELAAKADVKGRTKARAADLRDRAGAMTVQLRSGAAHVGHRAQDRAALTARNAPDALGQPLDSAVRTVRRNARPLLFAGAAGAAVLAVGLLLNRRRAHC